MYLLFLSLREDIEKREFGWLVYNLCVGGEVVL